MSEYTAITALRAIIAEPHGCPFCDSGKLRNPSKPHTDECGFGFAERVLAALEPVKAEPVAAWRTDIFESLPNGKLTRLILDASEVTNPDADWKPLYASPPPPAMTDRAGIIEECARLLESKATAQSEFQKSAYGRGDDIGGHGHWKAQCELLTAATAIRALKAGE